MTILWSKDESGGITPGPEDKSAVAMPPAEESGQSKPTLAENAEEATRMLYAGRSSVSLRESKVFDNSRLADMPLFKDQGRLF